MKTQDEFIRIGALMETFEGIVQYLKRSTEQQQLWDSVDVKNYLKISDKTLYRLRSQGDLPYVRIGKKYYYPAEFFRKFGDSGSGM